MIEITQKDKCCGCEVCKNVCPQKCIYMKEDEEGFRYPVIDKEKCTNCHLCEKKCPILHEVNNNYIPTVKCYAAYNRNDETLKKSSSGGIFFLLSEQIIKNNGVVYGVVQNSTFEICFERASTIEECERFRGSKYLQAEIGKAYILAKKDLLQGKPVLFSGTPCQIAGLYSFLGKDYNQLYTCDVVCHGVPSNAVYRKFIAYIESKYKKTVANIKWRDKVKGWGPNRITIYFSDNSVITTTSQDNIFQKGFLDNIYLRQSCYNCLYARLPRIGDISLADFWGYDDKFINENNNKGLSAVVISTQKGIEILEKIKPQIYFHEVEIEYLKQRSRHVYCHPEENKQREDFFKDFQKMKFEKVAKKYKMKSSQLVKFIKKVKRRIIRK